MRIITLTTDFGQSDWFVGTMKGVIASINPNAKVIDISHCVPLGDIRAGAFALMAAYRYFPAKTIHVAVVDPGVGSKRRSIVVETERYIFIGPDNGVLSWALRGERLKSIHWLENRKLALAERSATFHGRDVFAPAAAHLSRGATVSSVGPKAKSFVELPWLEPGWRGDALEGEVIYIDHFGNAITNISKNDLNPFKGAEVRILIGKRAIALGFCYAGAKAGKPLGVVNSANYLEIAVNGGSAAQKLKLRIGAPVTVGVEGGHRQSLRRSLRQS